MADESGVIGVWLAIVGEETWTSALISLDSACCVGLEGLNSHSSSVGSHPSQTSSFS